MTKRDLRLVIALAVLGGSALYWGYWHQRLSSRATIAVDGKVLAAPDVANAVSGKVPEPLTTTPTSTRPSPEKVFRAEWRAGYAWMMRQLGMSESDVDRLATGGFVALVKELMAKADQGNRSAAASLGWLALRCRLSRDDEQLNYYRQNQLLEARRLPSADAEWFSSLLNQDVDAERQRHADCTVIDQDHVHSLLEGFSAEGDGASTFMLAQSADNIGDLNRLNRLAAIQGFPEGEMEWAMDLMDPRAKGFYTAQPGDPTALDFLRQAATTLPSALGDLALCEYKGCAGELPDPNQAIADARAAAQQGNPDALLTLAKDAPPSLISPTETQAWKLFDQSLQQRGCDIGSFDVNWMKSMAALSANATPEAQALAGQTWQRYGTQAMQQLGC